MSLVGYRAKNHPQQVSARGADDGVDERITPDTIYNPLHATHKFSLDAAASAGNAKCPKYFSIQNSGLDNSWAGEVVWCNPPYSDVGAWVAKAFNETQSGCPKVVLLLPANRCEQKWWQKYIEPFRETARVRTNFLPGRPRFGWPPGRVVPPKGDRPPFGLVVVTISVMTQPTRELEKEWGA